MAQYWLISAPADGSKENTWKQLKSKTQDNDMSVNYKMEIPDLRVGTLDSLMALSDDLSKLDQYVENVTHRTERELREFRKGQEGLTIQQTPVETFLTRFGWDEARYPVRSTLRELVDLIQDQVTRTDEALKTRLGEFNSTKSQLATLDRKTTGNLNTRGLTDIVYKAMGGQSPAVVDTENLTTLLVVVNKSNYKDWDNSYESMVDGPFIVPRSSKLLHEDQEFGLFRVVLFKRVAEQFKTKARESKFNVREFTYDPEEYNREQAEKVKLNDEIERLWSHIARFSQTGYSECFIAWMHLKAIRIFVESTLRYGLPDKVNFQAMLLKPNKRSEQKLRKTLAEHYRSLQSSVYSDGGDDPGAAEFFPYVYIPINVFASAQ